MTIAELIETLKTCNPDAQVYMYTGDINLIEVGEVEQSAPSMVVIS